MHDYFEPPYDTPYQQAWEDEYDRLYRQDMYNRKDEPLKEAFKCVIDQLTSNKPNFDMIAESLIFLDDELGWELHDQLVKVMKLKERKDV